MLSEHCLCAASGWCSSSQWWMCCRVFYTCFPLSKLAPIFNARPQSLESFVCIIFWSKDWQVTVFLGDSQSRAVGLWGVSLFEKLLRHLYSTLSSSSPTPPPPFFVFPILQTKWLQAVLTAQGSVSNLFLYIEAVVAYTYSPSLSLLAELPI